MADRKTARIAREIRIFLERANQSTPNPRESIDEIVSPAVSFALNRLRASLPESARKIISWAAWNHLRVHLLARLALALTPTLRFQQEIARAVSRSTRLSRDRKREISDVTLFETVDQFRGALETAALLIADWIAAQKELVLNLRRDDVDLRKYFLSPRNTFRVERIQAGLSDPHCGGRTATMVEFVRGDKIVYKPRPGEGEAVWFHALGWLSKNGLNVRFRTPKILPRKNYLWMEFLRNQSCQNKQAVRLFYFRWGAQAAVATLLGVTDLHRENWLAVGAQPILVDAELIGDADRQSIPAVLQTGLLALTARDRVGFYRGLGPFDSRIVENGPEACWPKLRGVRQLPERYVSDLVKGFQAVARIFAQPKLARKFFREIVLTETGKAARRVLFRPSSAYVRLLRDSFQPRHMIFPGARARRILAQCRRTAPNRRIACAEARALLRCDLPTFTRRRKALPISARRFFLAVADLPGAARLLRRRVLLGTRAYRV